MIFFMTKYGVVVLREDARGTQYGCFESCQFQPCFAFFVS